MKKAMRTIAQKILCLGFGVTAFGIGACSAVEPVTIPAARFNASTKSGGWFAREGDDYDLSALPAGRRTMRRVAFVIGDPAEGPNVIMLAGAGSSARPSEVKGMPVDRACEVLYFLHTFNPGLALREWQRRNAESKDNGDRPLELPVLFRYVLRYADGESVTLNVRWGESVNDWLRAGDWADPPYAATAWKRTVSKEWAMDRWPRRGKHLAIYAMRYENPRAASKIASVDILSANDENNDWGAPAILAASTGAREYAGTTYYVAPDGSDDNPGTFDMPWATMYKAADTLREGDTVYVRGGRYKLRQDWQQVIIVKNSGTQAAPITFAAYPGETPVLDGYDHHSAYDTRVPYAIYDRDRGLFNIFEKMNITVRGLWVENSRKSGFGVYQSRNIFMDHNVVYGTRMCGMNTASNIHFRIIGNTLGKNCSVFYRYDHETQEWDPWKPGSGRIKVGGREGIDNHRNEYTEIAFNEIYWCSKEGIADPGRHFMIHHNHIHHLPHTPEVYWPSGIYLDAYGPIMDDIEVYDNVIHNASGGITIGSEGGTTATDIRVHHNLIFDNTWEGIGIGPAGGDGLRRNIVIEHNTILRCGHTDWERGPTGGINITTRNCSDITVRYNILAGHRDYNVSLHREIDRVKQGIAIHDNLCDPVLLPTERFEPRIRSWIPVLSDRAIPGNPQFVDPDKWNFTLQASSPAVDAIPDQEDEDGSAGDLGAFSYRMELPPLPEKGEGFVLRVNCGSDKAYTDKDGNTWKADRQLRRNSPSHLWGATWSGTVTRTARPIANTDDPEIYLTERYRMERYRFPIPPGRYTVRLHFAETWHQEPGSRMFAVSLNQRKVLDRFDPAREAGGVNAAVVREFEVPVHAKGLSIGFKAQGDLPMINGIEILQVTRE